MKIHKFPPGVNYKKKKQAKDFFFNNYIKGEEINVSKTAESLGVSRVTIYNWIEIINSK